MRSRPVPPARLQSPTGGRLLATVVLLAAGVALEGLFFGRLSLYFVSLGPWGPTGLAVLVLIVAGLVAVPASYAVLSAGLNGVRGVVAGHRTAAAAAAAVASVAYLYLAAHDQGRRLRPYVHDEFSYLIQAHQFARGRLWMPAHPLAPFFDSFQLFASPVYASAYFPGTAVLYVPGVWLHLPPWATSVAVAGVVAGLLFRISAELFDGVGAVLAVLLLWSDSQYRSCSTMVLAQMPLLMYGLAATVAWLTWRADRRRRWLVLAGACLSAAAVTRPLDALCFAAPVGLAVVSAAVASRRHAPAPAARPWSAVACLLTPVVPVLLVQLTLNRGITGRWTETPFRLYADRDYPGTAYGFQPFDPAARPASPLPQKRALYREYAGLLREHRPATILDDQLRTHGPLRPARLPVTLSQLTTTPFGLLIVLLPAALAGLTRRRAAVLATLPLFVVAYAGYVFFFPHYTLVVAAAVIVAVLAGAEQVPPLAGPWAGRLAAGLPLVLAGLAVAGLPEFDPSLKDDVFAAPLLDDVHRQLADLPDRPAVVLFTYDPHRNTHEEPVYNPTVAWPDDATIIRAHDLGAARDAELFAYYATHGPARLGYRYDERSRTLTPLGPVTAAAVRLR